MNKNEVLRIDHRRTTCLDCNARLEVVYDDLLVVERDQDEIDQLNKHNPLGRGNPGPHVYVACILCSEIITCDHTNGFGEWKDLAIIDWRNHKVSEWESQIGQRPTSDIFYEVVEWRIKHDLIKGEEYPFACDCCDNTHTITEDNLTSIDGQDDQVVYASCPDEGELTWFSNKLRANEYAFLLLEMRLFSILGQDLISDK